MACMLKIERLLTEFLGDLEPSRIDDGTDVHTLVYTIANAGYIVALVFSIDAAGNLSCKATLQNRLTEGQEQEMLNYCTALKSSSGLDVCGEGLISIEAEVAADEISAATADRLIARTLGTVIRITGEFDFELSS